MLLTHIGHTLARAQNVTIIAQRFRQRKILTWPIEYLPFKFTYPEKKDFIEESGDIVNDLGECDASKPRTVFSHLKDDIKSAPEHVKKIMSIEFGTSKERTETLMKEFVAKVQRHPLDTESLEYRIARKTFIIRGMKQSWYSHLNTRNKKLRTALLEIIAARNKLLKFLGRYDLERYNFVKEQLQIHHEFFPLGRPHQQFTRKGELTRLTEEWCKQVKDKKMEEFHASLLMRQKDFEQEKKDVEEWIEKEIKELKLTEEEIKSLEFKSSLR